MRDGYYLSTYLTPPGLAAAMGMWLRHDNNVSLWRKDGSDITLLKLWELERYSGMKKHGIALRSVADARDVLNDLLSECQLTLDDMVEVWGTPGLHTVDDYHLVDNERGIAYHSLSHLYSCMLLDSDKFFHEQVLGLAVDGGPDHVLERGTKPHWFAGGLARGGTLDVFPIESPGTLFFESRLRFALREGTLMALAHATDATIQSNVDDLLSRYRLGGPQVRELARAALDEIQKTAASSLDPGTTEGFTDDEKMISAVMKEIQDLSLAVVERCLDQVLERTGVDPAETHLALAGGYALNCPTNTYLMDKYGFRSLLAPPCVNDSGQSLGIALAAFHKKMGGERFNFTFPGPYLGHEEADVDSAVKRHTAYIADRSDFDVDTAVRDLVAGPVVWFDGAAEIGPRALGHRSILADPRSMAAKDELNRLKRRQWWRPVAPVVLEEHLGDWFEQSRPSPYMLENFTVLEARRPLVPAVTHFDGSARVQSLRPDQNPRLHELITAFHAATGVPMLCNTSLNDKGEPIIDTIDQAVNFCLRRGVAVIYISGHRIALRDGRHYPLENPLPRRYEKFVRPKPDEARELLRTFNPHGVDDVHVHLYLRNPALRSAHDITTEKGARDLTRKVQALFRTAPHRKRELTTYMARDRFIDAAGHAVDTGILVPQREGQAVAPQ